MEDDKDLFIALLREHITRNYEIPKPTAADISKEAWNILVLMKLVKSPGSP